jgi:hypothetical protein
LNSPQNYGNYFRYESFHQGNFPFITIISYWQAGKKPNHMGGNTFFAIQPSTYFYRKKDNEKKANVPEAVSIFFAGTDHSSSDSHHNVRDFGPVQLC